MDYPTVIRTRNLQSIEEAVCVTIGANKLGGFMSEDEYKKNGESASSMRPDQLFEWIERSRTGDTQAMGAIYDHFKTSLYGLDFRYTRNHAVAEDLLQDIFVKVFSNLHSLDNDLTFVGWLYRTDKLKAHIVNNLGLSGRQHHIFNYVVLQMWMYCIRFITPVALGIAIIHSLIREFEVPYSDYPISGIIFLGVGWLLVTHIFAFGLSGLPWRREPSDSQSTT